MAEKLDTGDIDARKGYISSIDDTIEVDDKSIRIIGSNDGLQPVFTGKRNANGSARGFVRKWRGRED